MSAGDDPHERALQLRQAAINAEVAYNNPDLAWPDTPPNRYPDSARLLAAADNNLASHLRAHRDTLGDHPDWQQQYDLLDNTPPPPPPESPWRRDQLFIGAWNDDPPF